MKIIMIIIIKLILNLLVSAIPKKHINELRVINNKVAKNVLLTFLFIT